MTTGSQNEATSRPYHFELAFKVRDYELDMQGVVNNAVYQHYLEHTRHEFLQHVGLSFEQLQEQGTEAMVHRIELEYRKPLQSNDRFVVHLRAEREGALRFVFIQDIYRQPDEVQMLRGRVTAVFMRNRRPIRPPEEVIRALEQTVWQRES